MQTWARASVLTALLLLLLGCAGRYAYSETRTLVRDDEPCTAEDQVADRERAEDAALTEEERIPMFPLCWYRLNVTKRHRILCEGLETNLAELRESSKSSYEPSAWGIKDTRAGQVLCSSEGPVLVLQADGDTCASSVLPGPAWDRGVDGWSTDLTPGALIASDPRPAYRSCIYEITRKRSSPSCGSAWPSP